VVINLLISVFQVLQSVFQVLQSFLLVWSQTHDFNGFTRLSVRNATILAVNLLISVFPILRSFLWAWLLIHCLIGFVKQSVHIIIGVVDSHQKFAFRAPLFCFKVSFRFLTPLWFGSFQIHISPILVDILLIFFFVIQQVFVSIIHFRYHVKVPFLRAFLWDFYFFLLCFLNFGFTTPTGFAIYPL